MTVQSNGSRKFLYIAVCIGNLVAFSSGIALGWTSPVNAKLKDANRIDENPLGEVISDEQDSWISSLFPFGAIFGPILAGFLADKIGRKYTLILCSGLPLLVSYITLAFAKHIYLYYFGRFLAGFAFGAVVTVLPIFNSEISEDSIRGRVASSMNVFVISGPLYSYVIGPYTSIMWFNLTCAVWPALFIVLFFLFVPESPYYLVAVNDSREAMASLRKFRPTSDSHIAKELELMELAVDDSTRRKGSFFDIFKSKGLTKAFIISMSLVGFQQLSGINIVLFNAQEIFDETGSKFSSEISSMIIGAVQMAASFVTPVLVDRVGRKMILSISATGMLISEVPLGLYFYLKDNNNDVSGISWLPMMCLIGYIVLYNAGFGVLPWVVMAEIFPTNVKASASTVTACFCWILGFILTKYFFSMKDAIGMGGSFWIFSGFCATAIPFLMFYMIETKGKSFHEIQDILRYQY